MPCGMWNLLRPGIELVSPALTDGFITTEPPGKSLELFDKYLLSKWILRASYAIVFNLM